MKAFRTPSPSCAKCNALGADTYGPNGDLLCRGCAGTMEANARLRVGNGTAKVGAALGIVMGVLMLFGGALILAVAESGKSTARLAGIFFGLGILAIVSSVQALKSTGSA